MTIAVDFDGTIVEHRYPEIGEEIPFATETLRMLIAERHKIILWSVREGRLLDEAVEWCRKRGVEFYAVNKDFPEEKTDKYHGYIRKIKTDICKDDRNIGGLSKLGEINHKKNKKKSYAEIIAEQQHVSFEDKAPKRKKHWWNI